MLEYVTIKKAIHEAVVKNPLTRIQGLLTWLQKTQLIEETE